MGQILPGSATTTEAICRAIQHKHRRDLPVPHFGRRVSAELVSPWRNFGTHGVRDG
jgi:hypothetical protein